MGVFSGIGLVILFLMKEGHLQLKLLHHAIDTLSLSGRAHHRIIKVARTIAGLAGDKKISSEHIAESLSLRNFDRLGQ